MWLTKLKLAIVQKDANSLDELLSSMPEYDAKKDLEEMTQVMYLFREAAEVLYTLQDETSASMKQIKKNIDFLNVTAAPKANKLNIKL